MKLKYCPLMAVILLCTPDQIGAQEIKCDQVFMNPSEKHICGSEELMRQDQIVGEMYRRAEPHIDGIKKVQRAFRRGLKTCKGDEACLMRSYETRIEELKLDISSLPPPTEEQITDLSEAAEIAESKRDEQADERSLIAAELPVEAAPVPIEPVVVQTPVLEVPVALEPVPEQVTPSKPIEWPWWAYLVLGLVVLSVWVMFWSWLQVELKRCPQCRRWSAGEVYDSDQSEHTDYETKTFEDTHRDKNYNVTGRTSRQRQVAVRVVNRIAYLKCRFCSKTWVRRTTSRSS